MTWIDYRKAYDSVPHSWILKVLAMYKVAVNIRGFLLKSMTTWRVALTLNGQTLGRVCIKRGLFQCDALSPLLFVMCLFPLTTLLRQLNKGPGLSLMVMSFPICCIWMISSCMPSQWRIWQLW